MSTPAYSIHSGMTVFTADGDKFGTVGNIFSGAPEPDTNQGPYSDSGSASPDAPTSTDWTGTTTGATGGGDGQGGAVTGPGGAQRVPYMANTDMEAGGPIPGAVANTAYDTAIGAEALAGGDAGGGGATVLTPSDTKYFEVHHGGLMGIGGTTYYVPFDAVQAVAPGTDVTLNCTEQQCVERYSQKPGPLGDSDTV